MTPQRTAPISSVTTSDPLVMDYQAGTPVGFMAALSAGGSATFTVECTYDDLYDTTITPTWVATSISGATASAIGSLAAPPFALRLNVTVYASGTVTLAALQGSIHG